MLKCKRLKTLQSAFITWFKTLLSAFITWSEFIMPMPERRRDLEGGGVVNYWLLTSCEPHGVISGREKGRPSWRCLQVTTKSRIFLWWVWVVEVIAFLLLAGPYSRTLRNVVLERKISPVVSLPERCWFVLSEQQAGSPADLWVYRVKGSIGRSHRGWQARNYPSRFRQSKRHM